MERIRNEAIYLYQLARTNLRAGTADWRKFALFTLMMFANNLVYFVIWMIYFDTFSSMRGWTLSDMATMMGVVAFGFGGGVLLFGGARNLTRIVMSGDLDNYLGRPKSPLPALLMSDSIPAGFGDVLSSFVFWLVIAGHSWTDLPVLLLLGVLVLLITTATIVMLHSLAFWASGTDRFADQMYEFFIILSTFPQHGFGFVFKILLFTLVPAGFVALLPVEIMRDFTPEKLAALVAAAVFYSWLAWTIFNTGLRRYTSANALR